MTLQEISLAAGIIVAAIIIVKFLWELINLKVSSQYKDYMSRDQLKELMIEVLKSQEAVTFSALIEFCKRAQQGCPKGNDVTSITSSFTTFTSTLKEVVTEQKKLRQETLPRDYPNMHLFDKTIERIERAASESAKRIEETVSKIETRLNEMSEGRKLSSGQ